MFVTYVVVTIFAALLYASAAVLAAGALGLVGGFALPILGTLAAYSLVLYFLGALLAHLRVGSRKLGNWSFFFATSVAALQSISSITGPDPDHS